jgi:hypothetical protein
MSSGTPSVVVERLALHVPTMSEDEARRLAEDVARALGRLMDVRAGGVESVTATVEAVGAGLLAERIAAAVMREIG